MSLLKRALSGGMQNLLTPANFEFFARYLLAGFIIMSVRSWFVAARRPNPGEAFFDAVILSLINQLAFLVITPAVVWAPPDLLDRLSSWTAGRAGFFFEVLVLPTALGAIFGGALSRNWVLAPLRRFALPNIHPTQRAYDFAFAQRKGPAFVIVGYKDGTQVYGYFGKQSLAASDEDRSDIYLERLYSIDETGQWLEAAPLRSALLVLDDVRSIEFLSDEGGPDE